MKIKAMLATILIAFIQPVNADIVKDIKNKFINSNIFEYQECVEKLIKQDLSKSKANNLCVDRYASKIDAKVWTKDSSKANSEGRVTINITNDSNSFVINKIVFRGTAWCYSLDSETDKNVIDKDICERQFFKGSKYVDIKPKSAGQTIVYDQFSIPKEVESGMWGWDYSISGVYGFALDY